MNKASSRRILSLCFVVSVVSGDSVFGQVVPPPMAGAPAQRLVRSTRYTINGATFIYQEFQESPEPIRSDPEMELDGVEQDDGELPRNAKVLMGDKALDQLIFGQGWTFDSAQQRWQEALRRELDSCDRAIELTDLQKQKLQLAGCGDISRFFENVTSHKLKFERLADGISSLDGFNEWRNQLALKSNQLRRQWSAPFGTESLFAKTLAKMVTPQQSAELERSRTNPVPAAPPGALPARPVRPAAPLVNARVVPGAAQFAAPRTLDDVLKRWEQASTHIERLDCTFGCYKYDNTFEIERRGTGSIAVDRQGLAVYRRGSMEIAPGEKSRRIGKDGEPYELRADTPERWHWTGESIVHVDEAQRTFEIIPLPAELQVARGFRPDPPELPQDDGIVRVNAPSKIGRKTWEDRMKEFWLARPFLLGMPAEELARRFNVKIARQSDKGVWLEFRPLREADAGWFERAVLILDAERFVPKALQMIDPTGSETVHVFGDVQINRLRAGHPIPPGVENLERPNLKGYRPAAIPVERGGQ